MSYSSFLCEINKGVAHVQINLAKKANCMTKEFWHELPMLMAELSENDAVSCVILSGVGKHFSSGIDANILVSIMDSDAEDKTEYIKKEIIKMQNAISSVELCKKPVIAAIHGACLGGAIDLITACDIRIASFKSAFSILETKLGIVADLGTLQRIPSIIGEGYARELAYTSRVFNSLNAKKYGLIRSVHLSKNSCLAKAFKLAEEISELPKNAVSGTKRSLNFNRDHGVYKGLEHIAEHNSKDLQNEQTAKQITLLKKMLSKKK